MSLGFSITYCSKCQRSRQWWWEEHTTRRGKNLLETGDCIHCCTHQCCLHVWTSKKGLITNRQTMTKEIHWCGSFSLYVHKSKTLSQGKWGWEESMWSAWSFRPLFVPFLGPSPSPRHILVRSPTPNLTVSGRKPLCFGLLRVLLTLAMPGPPRGHHRSSGSFFSDNLSQTLLLFLPPSSLLDTVLLLTLQLCQPWP